MATVHIGEGQREYEQKRRLMFFRCACSNRTVHFVVNGQCGCSCHISERQNLGDDVK